MSLTEGSIMMLTRHEVQPTDIQPVLQVTDIRLVSAAGAANTSERYRLLLSDGSHLQQGMLATQRNDLVRSNRLRKGSIVQLNQYVCNLMQNRMIIIIIDLEVKVEEFAPIGEPIHYNPLKLGNDTSPVTRSSVETDDTQKSNNTTAIGTFDYASTQKPPTSDEKSEMEKNFITKTMQVNKRNLEEDEFEKDVRIRRKSSTRKQPKMSRMDSCLDAWSKFLATKVELNKAKIEKYKAQTSSNSEPYSIEACMKILETMDDLDAVAYNKVLTKLLDADWRTFFIVMPDKRRKSWIEDL